MVTTCLFFSLDNSVLGDSMSWGGENLVGAGVVSSNPRGETKGRNTWEGLALERRRDPLSPKLGQVGSGTEHH